MSSPEVGKRAINASQPREPRRLLRQARRLSTSMVNGTAGDPATISIRVCPARLVRLPGADDQACAANNLRALFTRPIVSPVLAVAANWR